jgi:hypothetical protein
MKLIPNWLWMMDIVERLTTLLCKVVIQLDQSHVINIEWQILIKGTDTVPNNIAFVLIVCQSVRHKILFLLLRRDG